MKPFCIQFDPGKSRRNLAKHGIGLAEAEGVLFDEHALTLEDNDHDEQRWVSVGDDGTGRIVVVVYAYRDPNFIRLISARKAEPLEVDAYRGVRQQ